MSAVSLSADRRFRRAHVKPVRRRGSWRRLLRPLAKYGLLMIVVLFGMYRGRAVLARTGVLQVDRIVVRGNSRLSNGEVFAVLNGLQGQSLVWTDLDQWRRRLLSCPWIRDAALRRSLPSTVEVLIAEREPVAFGRINGELYLVDEEGVVIDQHGPQYADLDLPIVDGLSTDSGAAGAGVDEPRAQLAARLIVAVRGDDVVARRLSQIDVTDLHNAAVILSGDPAVIYVGQDRFLSRLQSYVELAGALRERVSDIDYVDLRFDDRIYVRPVSTSGKRNALAMSAAGGGETTR